MGYHWFFGVDRSRVHELDSVIGASGHFSTPFDTATVHAEGKNGEFCRWNLRFPKPSRRKQTEILARVVCESFDNARRRYNFQCHYQIK